jgi:NodT family efflux transporter outer membrane factor (OMF) lipoprotein
MNFTSRQGRLRPVAVACLLAALAGCAVGPEFKAPAAPEQPAGSLYVPGQPVTQTVQSPGAAGAVQSLQTGRDIPAQWWSVFRSPALDQLIRRGLQNSPTLAAAQAALRQAQENTNALTGSLQSPAITGQLAASRQRASAASTGIPGGNLSNLYNASVNVSYTVDLFGANRRALEGQQAALEFQQYQLEAAWLALTANLVTTAIREASLRGQLQATRELLQAQQKQLSVIEAQLAAGAISRSPVLAQRNTVAQTSAAIAPLEKSLALTRHQLSVYAGELPSQPGLPEFTLEALELPQELPLTLPSELARQRPDIRASEALLHQASAQVGVATANLYPQINLSGSFGSAATRPGNLFGAGWGFWSLGAGLVEPIFNGGALDARRRAAQAAYEQAAAQYRATVLGAFQNVADSLRALELDASALKSQAEVEALAREALELSTRQYQLGGVSYLVLLDAQRSYQQARINLVAARAARYADTAALFQSLGGGWWNRPLADPSGAAPTAVSP